jgi:hypothetical protein
MLRAVMCGTAEGLLDPAINMTYGTRYLAGACRAAHGNEARTLVLYAHVITLGAAWRSFNTAIFGNLCRPRDLSVNDERSRPIQGSRLMSGVI